MSPWVIYWWSQADSMREVLGVMSAMVLIIGGFGSVMYYAENNELPRWVKALLCAAVVAGFAAVLIPSSRTIALMYVLPRVADSDVIQRDMPELYRLAVDALKSELADGIGGQR